MDYKYKLKPCGRLFSEQSDECLEEYTDLFSNHYGVWSGSCRERSGQNIRFTVDKFKELISPEGTIIMEARLDNELIGYATVIQANRTKKEIISWVTQFVVHEDHRNNNVGETLLSRAWGISDHTAWGLISSSPYAIRALEKATRRRCVPKRIKENWKKLFKFGDQRVAYINKSSATKFDDTTSMINTEFFVDHAGLEEMIKNVTTEDTPWSLGELEEGWEWVAFTFHNQDQIKLSLEEKSKLFQTADDITRQAYGRMEISTSHTWAKHTDKEATQIEIYCQLKKGDALLDLGCGQGRHSFALADMGYKVTGVDYNKSNAWRTTADLQFIQGDCRDINLGRQFDAVICLYDVIGTYVNDSDNNQIMSNISRHLKKGGFALISVMNLELTKKIATQFFTIDEQPDKLLTLPAAKIMEKTGNIFNPKYFMIDVGKSIVYRKERFEGGSTDLPAELLVRDRRFSDYEIVTMCKNAGLKITWSRFVKAGAWEKQLDRLHGSAKEILLLCEKIR